MFYVSASRKLPTSRYTNSIATGEVISRIISNRKFRYRVHISPPLVHILGQWNPVQVLPLYFFKISFTITSVETLIVATIYLKLIQNRYMFRSFTVLQCSHQHCVQPVASDVEVVGYL